MIPKSTIIVHIYILLILIYVYQNGRNWKFQNCLFYTTYIYYLFLYMCTKTDKNGKVKKIRFECACTRKLYM